MKLKVNQPPTPICAVCLCAGIPSMHSASAQLDSPRCQAAVMAYRTPDDWSSHTLPVALCQAPGSRGSRGSRGSASPLYLQFPLTEPTVTTAAKELWINSLSLSRTIFMEDRSCFFFCRLCRYFVFVGNWKVCTHLVGLRDNTMRTGATVQKTSVLACVCVTVCVSW